MNATAPTDLDQSYVNMGVICEHVEGETRRWRLTLEAVRTALNLAVDNGLHALHFPAGTYHCDGGLVVDLATMFDSDKERRAYEHLRHGLSWRGDDLCSRIELGTGRSEHRPAFMLMWSLPENGTGEKRHVFHWNFTGLTFGGDWDNVLVHLGHPSDVDAMAFNSSVVDLSVNNGYVPDNQALELSSPARGLVLVRFLQSRLNLVCTSATGIAAHLHTCEFSKLVTGSFSNSEIMDSEHPESDTATGMRVRHGQGLLLHDCIGLTLGNVNCEVTCYGLALAGGTTGTTVQNIIRNNCDRNAHVIVFHDGTREDTRNVVQMLVRRNTRQTKAGGFQGSVCKPEQLPADCLTVMCDIQT